MEIVSILTIACAFACSVCAVTLWLRRQTLRHEARWARNHGPVRTARKNEPAGKDE